MFKMHFLFLMYDLEMSGDNIQGLSPKYFSVLFLTAFMFNLLQSAP